MCRTEPAQFTGRFVLADLAYAAHDLVEIADRLQWASEKLREMHQGGVQLLDPRPLTEKNELVVCTTDPDLAERWDLVVEGTEKVLSITTS